jgi:hypothetical protein
MAFCDTILLLAKQFPMLMKLTRKSKEKEEAREKELKE